MKLSTVEFLKRTVEILTDIRNQELSGEKLRNKIGAIEEFRIADNELEGLIRDIIKGDPEFPYAHIVFEKGGIGG